MFKLHSRSCRSRLQKCAANVVKYGDSRSVPIDQTLGKDFNINPETGHPDYYVTKLIRESSNAGFESAFAQLQEFRSNSLPAEMTAEQALEYIKPRSCQTPAEVVSFRAKLAERLESQRLQAAEVENAKKLAEEDEKLYSSLINESSNSD